MKKEYIRPECEMIIFVSEDIISTSTGMTKEDTQALFMEYDASYFK
ncbi:MAG: hypothetical protein IJ583_07960 [Firmicutes bacterium]|nr:hypothetical protein [Bacillota bacterium]